MVADARCARASESILFGSSPFSTAARKHDANAGSNSRKPSITMLRMSGSAIASDAAVGAVFTENARPRAAVATSLISVRTILSGSSGASEHRGSCHLSCQCIQRAYSCPPWFLFSNTSLSWTDRTKLFETRSYSPATVAAQPRYSRQSVCLDNGNRSELFVEIAARC